MNKDTSIRILTHLPTKSLRVSREKKKFFPDEKNKFALFIFLNDGPLGSYHFLEEEGREKLLLCQQKTRRKYSFLNSENLVEFHEGAESFFCFQ